MVIGTNVILTRQHARKLANMLHSIAGLMEKEDIIEISMMDNTIVVETEDIVSMLKLETQE